MPTTIYQVLKDGEPIYGGFYRYKAAAQEYADERNYAVILQIMKDVNRMNGALRGANRGNFMECVDLVAKPPYTVKKVSVSDKFR